jgi:hypothetical protein
MKAFPTKMKELEKRGKNFYVKLRKTMKNVNKI